MQPYTLFPWLVVKKCHSSSNPVIFVLHTYIGEIFILKCSTITEVLDMLYSWQQDFDVMNDKLLKSKHNHCIGTECMKHT
jgi:hypothetical protein